MDPDRGNSDSAAAQGYKYKNYKLIRIELELYQIEILTIKILTIHKQLNSKSQGMKVLSIYKGSIKLSLC